MNPFALLKLHSTVFMNKIIQTYKENSVLQERSRWDNLRAKSKEQTKLIKYF